MVAIIHPRATTLDAGPASPRAAQVVRRVVDALLDWQDRSRQRHALGTLDDRMLRDIGLTRVQALGEMHKAAWKD